MENATKALLIAAGIFFAMMIISVAILGFQNITNYYLEREKNKETEQLAKFNKQYSNYNRDDVRGSDLISLVNKIIDYNKANEDDPAIEPIEIIIEPLVDEDFYYDYDDHNEPDMKLLKLNVAYEEPTTDTNKSILSLLEKVDQIEGKYPKGKANKLANNITVLFITDENQIRNRKDYLEDLKVTDTGDELTNDILKYYQYVQFKRAHFDCKQLTYTNDGRVKKFVFEFNGEFE